MSWKIIYSSQARQDLRNIFEYIFNELCSSEAEPWKSMGLRFFPVDNYLVFYLPTETEHIINIVRIMYGGQDVRKQLTETIDF